MLQHEGEKSPLERQSSSNEIKMFELGRLQVNLISRQVFFRENPVEYTPKEFDLLEMLLMPTSQVLTHL